MIERSDIEDALRLARGVTDAIVRARDTHGMGDAAGTVRAANEISNAYSDLRRLVVSLKDLNDGVDPWQACEAAESRARDIEARCAFLEADSARARDGRSDMTGEIERLRQAVADAQDRATHLTRQYEAGTEELRTLRIETRRAERGETSAQQAETAQRHRADTAEKEILRLTHVMETLVPETMLDALRTRVRELENELARRSDHGIVSSVSSIADVPVHIIGSP